MSRPARWKSSVDAARAEACLAVRLYNDPAEQRSFEAFIVHMHLAWLYLLHATFQRDGIDYRYRRRDNPRLLEKVDGEPKTWELAKCVAEHWTDQDPVRANIEFFIALRNKIEHRYTRFQQELAIAVGGRSQAFLLNFEEELTKQFGPDVSLATVLRFPMFIGSFTAEGQSALERLHAKLPAGLRQFIVSSTAGLPDDVVADAKYDMRLRVYLELVKNPASALPIKFIREDDMTDDQRKLLKDTGLVIVREQQRDVTNCGWMKPHQVVTAVSARIPYVYNMSHFVQGWKAEGIRPSSDSKQPARTKEQYCRYDEPHRDYTYSEAYVEHLVRHLDTESGFQKLTGKVPQLKPVPQAVAS
ncbi:DUF3644 domain-containing protein [Mycobacteroides abscessus]|uniref:DUF3644 domain-containing protein n=1 Tax=Mycobacteroides abscessus TaxID=36809 RepID=UPI0018781B17|nr:hypothetical protein [Mycobacteroides abscessus]MDM2082845.1 DUF3644 domain-containing protein [Mycobacteroides abscessus]MDM2086019.1 DUF3644 domain-containing protein [Mycobacteroides abscessus]